MKLHTRCTKYSHVTMRNCYHMYWIWFCEEGSLFGSHVTDKMGRHVTIDPFKRCLLQGHVNAHVYCTCTLYVHCTSLRLLGVHIRSPLVRSCDCWTGIWGHVTVNPAKALMLPVNVIMKVCLECSNENTGKDRGLDSPPKVFLLILMIYRGSLSSFLATCVYIHVHVYIQVIIGSLWAENSCQYFELYGMCIIPFRVRV